MKNEFNVIDMAVLSDFKISDNIGETDDGYMICYRVPVARIGTQEYTGAELGIMTQPTKIYTVFREEEDVFSVVAMRSAEGKPCTDDHPRGTMVNSDNIKMLQCGHGCNARRNGDFLMMDLVITDKNLQEKIRNGKREVSLGYTCNWVEVDNGFKQTNIKINHIAIVDKARAGRKAAIRDNDPSLTRESKPMTPEQIRAALLKGFVNDSVSADDVQTAMRILDIKPTAATPAPVADAAPQPAITASPVGDANAGFIAKLLTTLGVVTPVADSDNEKVTLTKKELKALVADMAKEEAEAASDEDEEAADDYDLEDEDEDTDQDTADEDEDETNDEETAGGTPVAVDSVTLKDIRKALGPALKKCSAKDQSIVKKALAPFLGRSANHKTTAKILKPRKKATKDNDNVIPVGERGKAIAKQYNPHYDQKAGFAIARLPQNS